MYLTSSRAPAPAPSLPGRPSHHLFAARPAPPRARRYTIKAGAFVVCSSDAGVIVTNTATLTPQQAGVTGVPIMATASVNLIIWGCSLPPDVNFQNLQTWGAQTFSWQMTKRATR